MTNFEKQINEAIKKHSQATIEVEEAESEVLSVLMNAETDDKEKTNVAIRFNLSTAIDLQGKIGEYYESVLTLLDDENVAWKDITNYLQTVVFAGSYPLKENGKPEPLNKQRDAGNEAAIMINRFNSYRGKYSDYGVTKPMVEKVVNVRPLDAKKTELELETEKAIENIDAKKAVEKEKAKPVVFNKADIPVALVFMYKDVEATDDLVLIKAVEALADYYEIDL